MVDIRQADRRHLARLSGVFGRALVTEPMMAWPLGGRAEDLEDRSVRVYQRYLGPLLDAGVVWESTDGRGAVVLVPPEAPQVWEDALAHVDDATTGDLTDDGGQRHDRFWEWVGSKIPAEPLWHLDSVAVEPGWQGRGIGSALVRFGLEQARASRTAIVLETGTPRNIPLYERLGFQVIEEADPPGGGPHVWFMRGEPW